MSHRAFAKIYLHVVWHTKDILPLITPDVQKLIFACIKQRCDKQQVILFSLGGTENHLHFAAKIPPSIQIAAWIGELKGASSFEVNQTANQKTLAWQAGYGVVSFREKELGMIISYIENQLEHHAKGTTYSNLEKISDD